MSKTSYLSNIESRMEALCACPEKSPAVVLESARPCHLLSQQHRPAGGGGGPPPASRFQTGGGSAPWRCCEPGRPGALPPAFCPPAQGSRVEAEIGFYRPPCLYARMSLLLSLYSWSLFNTELKFLQATLKDFLPQVPLCNCGPSSRASGGSSSSWGLCLPAAEGWQIPSPCAARRQCVSRRLFLKCVSTW